MADSDTFQREHLRISDELRKAGSVAEAGGGKDVVLKILGIKGWAVESQVYHYASGDVTPVAADGDGVNRCDVMEQ